MKKTFLISLVGFALFLSGCVTQTSTPNLNQVENQPNTNLNQDLNKINPQDSQPKTTGSTLCTSKPTITEAGSEIYPIDKKYSNINFLGQIFTAYKCGDERIKKINGVAGDNYTLGSTIILNTNPTPTLIKTLESIGYVCGNNSSAQNCQNWKLEKNVKIIDLLKLEPFYQNFKSDDCINCG